jgi:hypothetical protein
MNESTAVTLKPELVEELLKAVKNPNDLFGPLESCRSLACSDAYPPAHRTRVRVSFTRM